MCVWEQKKRNRVRNRNYKEKEHCEGELLRNMDKVRERGNCKKREQCEGEVLRNTDKVR